MEKEYTFELSRSEKATAVWRKVQKHFQYQLARERKRNDGRMSVEDTAAIRGKIALLKELIVLDEANPDAEADEE